MYCKCRLIERDYVTPLMRYRHECPANRYVFKSRLNCSESTAGSLIQSGSEFQTVGPATEKARVPKLPRRTSGTNSWWRLADRSYVLATRHENARHEMADHRNRGGNTWHSNAGHETAGHKNADLTVWKCTTWKMQDLLMLDTKIHVPCEAKNCTVSFLQ